MKKIILTLILAINFFTTHAQRSYEIKSNDGKVIAENFIGFGEGRDSVIVRNKGYKLKFSYHTPLFDFKEDNGYSPIDISFSARHIKHITTNIYLLIGVGGNTNLETELHLVFIKKNKILKYYVIVSNDKRLRDITFEYLPKTKEIIFPITKEYTPQDYIYDVILKENSLDTIKPMKAEKDSKFYQYKLKVK
ncbi:hypothetical protein Q4566_15030 [Tamlana sp. 2_MG-2023]|uniref:hypothetical protein n=1 Tax=unclassified Tamlana TaxID=2614803 RepID=UPI0026E2472C|nr:MULTISPECIES: hypothetical protein [unclassified Tamlana]MDO6761524.1 hypothetical protein [Tamlana sp. 2_MG-2023]MDO6792382.1 hypothetical protein [Tamlana sp. 1_MG-2023]